MNTKIMQFILWIGCKWNDRVIIIIISSFFFSLSLSVLLRYINYNKWFHTFCSIHVIVIWISLLWTVRVDGMHIVYSMLSTILCMHETTAARRINGFSSKANVCSLGSALLDLNFWWTVRFIFHLIYWFSMNFAWNEDDFRMW